MRSVSGHGRILCAAGLRQLWRKRAWVGGDGKNALSFWKIVSTCEESCGVGRRLCLMWGVIMARRRGMEAGGPGEAWCEGVESRVHGEIWVTGSRLRLGWIRGKGACKGEACGGVWGMQQNRVRTMSEVTVEWDPGAHSTYSGGIGRVGPWVLRGIVASFRERRFVRECCSIVGLCGIIPLRPGLVERQRYQRGRTRRGRAARIDPIRRSSRKGRGALANYVQSPRSA